MCVVLCHVSKLGRREIHFRLLWRECTMRPKSFWSWIFSVFAISRDTGTPPLTRFFGPGKCEWPDLIKLSKEAANSVPYLTLVSRVISLAPSICAMKLTLYQPIFKRFCLHCGLSITAALESTRKELLLQRIYILLVATADNYIHTNVTTADSMLLLW